MMYSRAIFFGAIALTVLINRPSRASDLNAQLRAGAAIYADTCRACHGPKGEGVEELIPRLAGSQIANEDNVAVVTLILRGGKVPPTAENPTSPAMPSLGWRLNDQEIVDVLTYVRHAWGNQGRLVSVDEVKELRQ